MFWLFRASMSNVCQGKVLTVISILLCDCDDGMLLLIRTFVTWPSVDYVYTHAVNSCSSLSPKVTTTIPNSIDWDTKWNAELENGGCANTSIIERHNSTQQDVVWVVHDPPAK